MVAVSKLKFCGRTPKGDGILLSLRYFVPMYGIYLFFHNKCMPMTPDQSNPIRCVWKTVWPRGAVASRWSLDQWYVPNGISVWGRGWHAMQQLASVCSSSAAWSRRRSSLLWDPAPGEPVLPDMVHMEVGSFPDWLGCGKLKGW